MLCCYNKWVYQHLVGRSKNAAKHPTMQDSPLQQRIILPRMSVVPRWRNPALVSMSFIECGKFLAPQPFIHSFFHSVLSSVLRQGQIIPVFKEALFVSLTPTNFHFISFLSTTGNLLNWTIYNFGVVNLYLLSLISDL